MSGRRTQAERRAATSAALVDAAISTLAEAGYAGTSLAAVAGRAELTTGAVQRCFGTKSALLVAVYEAMVAEELATFEALIQVAANAAPDGRVESLVRGLWRTLDRRSFQAAIELERAARADDMLRDAITSSRALASARVGDLLSDAFEDDAPFRAVATTVVLALRGLALNGELVSDDDADRVLQQVLIVARATLGQQ